MKKEKNKPCFKCTFSTIAILTKSKTLIETDGRLPPSRRRLLAKKEPVKVRLPNCSCAPSIGAIHSLRFESAQTDFHFKVSPTRARARTLE